MKPNYSALFLAASLAAVGAAAGCGGGNATQTSAPAAPGAPMAAKSAAAPASGAATALGKPQPAGPFTVALTAPPKAGIQPFTAAVLKNGQPVKNAAVVLTLSMPSMGMSNPSVNLKPSGDHYSGTANIGMAGDWKAKVTVKAAGAAGSATFPFKAADQ